MTTQWHLMMILTLLLLHSTVERPLMTSFSHLSVTKTKNCQKIRKKSLAKMKGNQMVYLGGNSVCVAEVSSASWAFELWWLNSVGGRGCASPMKSFGTTSLAPHCQKSCHHEGYNEQKHHSHHDGNQIFSTETFFHYILKRYNLKLLALEL